MDKALRLIALLLLLTAPAAASDIYFAQSSAGGNTGADCADARAVSSMASGDYIAGNTLHLCGTGITGFSILGSGSAGNVITIKWEVGARMSVADGGLININGAKSYLLFDGGFACGPNTSCDAVENANMTGYATGQTGIIEATANGSGLVNQSTNTQAFYGCDGCHDIEIRNLIIRNLYQHTSTSDNTSSADSGNFAFSCPSGSTSGCVSGTISIHDSFIHDTGNAIQIQKNSSNTALIYNNDFARNNWALDYSGNGTRTLKFHNNVCRDAKNWDTGVTDTFHHNCVHGYMNTPSDSIFTGFYNNLSEGDWGSCCTTSNGLFVEIAPPANLAVFNNVNLQSCNSNTEPGYSSRTVNTGAGPVVYNNTYLGCATTGSNVEALDLWGTSISAENNAIEGYGQYVVVGASPNTTFTTLDYNIYGAIGMSGNAPWVWGASNETTFANWQSASSGDSHGQKVSSIRISSSTGTPNTGSPLIGACVNLTSIATGNLAPLALDFNGNPRPSVAAWDCGALNYIASTTHAPLIF